MSEQHDPLRSLWTAQKAEPFSMSLADIHERAERFQSRIRWRNLIEYGAGGIVVFAFGAIAVETPNWGIRAGVALIIAGILYMSWKLATLAGAAKKGEGASWVEFHRAELVRQRDALKGVWRWYLAPLLPGITVFIAASAFAGDVDIPLAACLGVVGLGVAWVAAVFYGIAWINMKAARRLEVEIDALDAARE